MGSNLLLTVHHHDIVDSPANGISPGAKHVSESPDKCQRLATKDLTRSRPVPVPAKQTSCIFLFQIIRRGARGVDSRSSEGAWGAIASFRRPDIENRVDSDLIKFIHDKNAAVRPHFPNGALPVQISSVADPVAASISLAFLLPEYA